MNIGGCERETTQTNTVLLAEAVSMKNKIHTGYYRGAAPWQPDDPSPIGILLTNVGTPDSPSPRALRPYLAQFLGDKRIVEWPGWLWKPILHGILLNTRPRKSARLYQRIWTESGSPLLLTLQRQAEALQIRLDDALDTPIKVAFGMSYGQPSIRDGLRSLDERNVQRILVLPLFPQYSATTTGASLDAVFSELKRWRRVPELRTVSHYHNHSLYIQALVNTVQEQWALTGKPERLLFSFHGIPRAYALKGDPYDRQCQHTARLVADALGLADSDWMVSFQSRLGPMDWLQPYTDEILKSWGQEQLGHVDALCPGFSADCLETSDEIGHEGKLAFQGAGGGQFHYIPALNVRSDHLDALTGIIVEHLKGWLGLIRTCL